MRSSPIQGTALEIYALTTETLTVRAVVQRVSRAQVSVAGEVAGKIGPGLLVLLGVSSTDTEADADYLAAKIAGLRIFTGKHGEDENGKMNHNVAEVGGGVLVVSQFTLYGMSAGESVRRSMPPPLRSGRGSSMNILWSASVPQACPAKPAAFRR